MLTSDFSSFFRNEDSKGELMGLTVVNSVSRGVRASRWD